MPAFFTVPHRIFLWIALPFGLIMVFLIPPIGGGDELHHFQRAYEIANGYTLGVSKGPAGIDDFQVMSTEFELTALREKRYDPDYWQRLREIPLQKNIEKDLLTNPQFMGQFPLVHIFYILPMKVGVALNLSPLTILYLCRLAGFLCATILMYHAIRLMPTGGHIMAAFALLPTSVFYRSFIHSDGFTVGISFLFIACLLRWGRKTEGFISREQVISLIVMATLMATAKGGYFPLACMSFLIRDALFAKRLHSWIAKCLIALIPIAFVMLWGAISNQAIFDQVAYETWAGTGVSPGKQMEYVMAYPVQFSAVVLSYLFSSDTLWELLKGLIAELGWMKIYLNDSLILTLAAALFALMVFESKARSIHFTLYERVWIMYVLCGTLITTLLMMYAIFNPVGSDTIKSYQGRHLLPMLPLLLFLTNALQVSSFSWARGALLWFIGIAGCGASIVKLSTFYYV